MYSTPVTKADIEHKIAQAEKANKPLSMQEYHEIIRATLGAITYQHFYSISGFEKSPKETYLELRSLLKNPLNKIAAIKLFRISTGLGLLEAKNEVEAMQKNLQYYPVTLRGNQPKTETKSQTKVISRQPGKKKIKVRLRHRKAPKHGK